MARPPAVKLLDGDRQDADAAGDRNARFDEFPDDVGVFTSEGLDGHSEDNAVAHCPQPDHGGQSESDDAQRSLHAGTNRKNSGCAEGEPRTRGHDFHTPGLPTKSIGAASERKAGDLKVCVTARYGGL